MHCIQSLTQIWCALLIKIKQNSFLHAIHLNFTQELVGLMYNPSYQMVKQMVSKYVAKKTA